MYLLKKDCFAYNKFKSKCEALDNLYCIGHECEFYKTIKENDYKELQARKNIKNKFWKDMYL